MLKTPSPEFIQSWNDFIQDLEQFYHGIIPILKKYDGKKVRKTTPYETLIKKLKEELQEVEKRFPNLRVVYDVSSYFVWANVKSVHNSKIHKNIKIGDIQNKFFLSVGEKHPHFQQYNSTEISEIFGEIKELEEKISVLRIKISDFI
jgi:hypothetical protein